MAPNSFLITDEESVKGHGYTAGCNVGAQPFSDTGKLPKGAKEASLVAIEERGPERS